MQKLCIFLEEKKKQLSIGYRGLGDMCGFSASTIHEIIKQNIISDNNIKKLCKALRYDYDKFYSDFEFILKDTKQLNLPVQNLKSNNLNIKSTLDKPPSTLSKTNLTPLDLTSSIKHLEKFNIIRENIFNIFSEYCKGNVDSTPDNPNTLVGYTKNLFSISISVYYEDEIDFNKIIIDFSKFYFKFKTGFLYKDCNYIIFFIVKSSKSFGYFKEKASESLSLFNDSLTYNVYYEDDLITAEFSPIKAIFESSRDI